MSNYYHIDPDLLTIISGPYWLAPGQLSYPAYCKKLCGNGNPGDMPAEMLCHHGLVPLVVAELMPGQKHGALVVYADRVEMPAVEMSAQDKQADLAGKINAKYSELVDAYNAAYSSLFAGYTEKQRETFWLQVKEAEGVTADPQHPIPFILGRTQDEQVNQETVVGIILGESAAIKPSAGNIYGKLKRLQGALADVDSSGDYATGCAAVEAINW